MKTVVLLILMCAVTFGAAAQKAKTSAQPIANSSDRKPNILLFITDGLRHDVVTPETAPTIFSLRQQGVDFVNSHSLYPTVTTANASAFATGHQLGDTGDFGNALYEGHAFLDGTKVTIVPFIENDLILGKLNGLRNNNYLQHETILDLARHNHYCVATVGKLGPAAIQDIADVKVNDKKLQSSELIIDDRTGSEDGIPLDSRLAGALAALGLGGKTPDRNNGSPKDAKDAPQSNATAGDFKTPGTLASNRIQQQYFADVATQRILPNCGSQPFFLVFWSRDPDGSQHNQGDSLNQLSPGINGATSFAGIRNADNNLAQIIGYLKANNLYANTDILIVADHGFSTISKASLDIKKTKTTSPAADPNQPYTDVVSGNLPPGFLALDLATALKKSLYDPDLPPVNGKYKCILGGAEGCLKTRQHPSGANGIIGGTGMVPQGDSKTDAEIIVAANGGSDLIYLPQVNEQSPNKADQDFAKDLCSFLAKQDYVDGIFVRDNLGPIGGALLLSDIGLNGDTNMPKPAIVVNFKSFSLDSSTPQLTRLTRVEIADSTLQEGQGMHGSFSRADTYNNMVASGPDFKAHVADLAPVSNADIAGTIAEIMGLKLPDSKSLPGRILTEALSGRKGTKLPDQMPQAERLPSTPPNGKRTLLMFQTYEGHRYYDQACFVTADQPDCK